VISHAIRSSSARTRVGVGPGLTSVVDPDVGMNKKARRTPRRTPARTGGVVDRVAHPAQAAADHLLAQELRAEGADAEDVRQAATRWRTSLTSRFSSMRSAVHSVSNWSCVPFFLGRAIGMK
jgi:hypothetical protein